MFVKDVQVQNQAGFGTPAPRRSLSRKQMSLSPPFGWRRMSAA